MFDMRFKRIQTAIADGRLDEAYELLREPDLRTHRQGQKLLTKLSEACIQRGREHLAAQRLAAALDDCNRAEKLAGNTTKVKGLRNDIAAAIEEARLNNRQKADQLAKAKEQLENGMLSTGRQMLEGCDDGQAIAMLQNARLDRTAAQSAVKRIQAALKNNDLRMAIDLYRQTKLETSGHEQALTILSEIRSQTVKQIQQYIKAGQLAAATNLLGHFNGQVKQWDDLYNLRQAVDCCVRGSRSIQAGRFSQAAMDLQKAHLLVPEAGWIKDAVKDARAGAAAMETLQTGPLGLVETESDVDNESEKKTPHSRKLTKQNPSLDTPDRMKHNTFLEPNPDNLKCLLQIDGIGSFVVLTADQVQIGPISSTAKVDLGLVTSPDARVKRVERTEGDYFVSDAQNLSGTHLLSDGDRIEISPRCRMQFTLPNPASGTAFLKLSSARLPRSDIQGVILMDREILIGPARNCHIQNGQVQHPVTLFGRDGHLFYRGSESLLLGGEAANAGQPIGLNQTAQIGSLRFVLTEYNG